MGVVYMNKTLDLTSKLKTPSFGGTQTDQTTFETNPL